MERETFLDLPVEEVAALVHAAGPKVCAFPIHGTRRWCVLEQNGTEATQAVRMMLVA